LKGEKVEITILQSGGGSQVYMGAGNDTPIYIGGGTTEADAILQALESLKDAIQQLETWHQ
jgi:hypothetical protein